MAKGKSFGDTSKISQEEFSARTKKGVLREDPPESYTPPAKGSSKVKK